MGQVLGVKSPADPVLSASLPRSASRKWNSKAKASMASAIFLPRECLFYPRTCPSFLPADQDLLRTSYLGRSE